MAGNKWRLGFVYVCLAVRVLVASVYSDIVMESPEHGHGLSLFRSDLRNLQDLLDHYDDDEDIQYSYVLRKVPE